MLSALSFPLLLITYNLILTTHSSLLFRYNILTIAWAVFILILTLTPGQYMPHPTFKQFSFDKAAHIFVFLVLSFLMIRGLKKQYSSFGIRVNAVLISIVFCVFYGLLIEVIQSFIPGRFFEWDDAIADAVGAFGGWIVFATFVRQKV